MSGFQITLEITKTYIFYWDLIFVVCPTHEIHKIKCPTNINKILHCFDRRFLRRRKYSGKFLYKIGT